MSFSTSFIGASNETNFDIPRSRWSTRLGGMFSGRSLSRAMGTVTGIMVTGMVTGTWS